MTRAALAIVLVLAAIVGCGSESSFRGEARPIPPALRRRMVGVSWHDGCPVGLDALSLVELDYWGFDARAHRGRIVVASAVASDVLGAFHALYDARFPIARMEPVDGYGADDLRSMQADNTSAFNCRRTTSGTRWSEHSYGTAIDINPVQNPYVDGDLVLPRRGASFANRSRKRPGMIGPRDEVVRAFRAIGWSWGGAWTSPIDYQHFSRSGR